VNARAEVLTVVTLKITVYKLAMSCRLLLIFWRNLLPHLQGNSDLIILTPVLAALLKVPAAMKPLPE
jgi:hypothetical protein